MWIIGHPYWWSFPSLEVIHLCHLLGTRAPTRFTLVEPRGGLQGGVWIAGTRTIPVNQGVKLDSREGHGE